MANEFFSRCSLRREAVPTLKRDPQPQLQSPVAGARQYSSERRRGDAAIRRAELRAIENIERLGPELDVVVFADQLVAHQRKVEVVNAGCAQSRLGP